MGYATDVLGVQTSLVDLVESCTSFGEDKVFTKFIAQTQGLDFPVCFIRLRSDTQKALGPKETQHMLEFRVEIHTKAVGSETDLTTLVGLVGEIDSGIEADRRMNNTLIQNTEVATVDYSIRRATAGLFFYAYMTIMVRILRNV